MRMKEEEHRGAPEFEQTVLIQSPIPAHHSWLLVSLQAGHAERWHFNRALQRRAGQMQSELFNFAISNRSSSYLTKPHPCPCGALHCRQYRYAFMLSFSKDRAQMVSSLPGWLSAQNLRKSSCPGAQYTDQDVLPPVSSLASSKFVCKPQV